jgi:hypothetical protein
MMRKTLILVALAATALPVPVLAQGRPAPPMAAPVDPAVAALRDAALKDDVAYDIVEGITTEVGPRLAGTEAEARARAWGVAKLTALGFKNVRIETYQMPVWVRGEESATILSPFPQPLRLAALGNSGATPKGGLTAELVYFESFAALQAAPDESLKGKIAFVSNAMVATQDGSSYGTFSSARFVGPNVAAKKGAAAILVPTGSLLFLSKASELVASRLFVLKMALIAAAVRSWISPIRMATWSIPADAGGRVSARSRRDRKVSRVSWVRTSPSRICTESRPSADSSALRTSS